MRVELRYLHDCANVAAARTLLRSTLAELGLDQAVVEEEGEYPSPSILVDGRDVMGQPEALGPSCRLDIPTRERLAAALLAASRG